MASGKIKDAHFRPTYNDGTLIPDTDPAEYKYEEWFTPAAGFHVVQATLRHVERNVYYVYIQGRFVDGNGAVVDGCPAYKGALIGNYKAAYFDNKPIAGYVPALCYAAAQTSDPTYRVGAAVFQVTTSIYVRGVNYDTGYIYVNGPIIRREV